jgi:deoxyadenosine/deoxycytidine kinase
MWLAIEGVVGAGKTTTGELVGSLTELRPVLERSEDHPFLEAYYRDPARHAIETELAFMLLQAHQLRAADAPNALVSDFSPAKNLIFARLNCCADDLRFLEAVDSRLWRDLPRPDLTVFLDVPTDVCLARVVSRGREYEQGLVRADLEKIRNGYVEALQTLGTEVRRVALQGTETPTAVAAAVMQSAGLQSRI